MQLSRALAGFAMVALAGCSDEPRVAQRATALDAYCSAMVVDVGEVDVETDYLPHVVACENGAASYEALRAQAVAARSYLYYRLDREGRIYDGTSDQVYSCGRDPGPDHFLAAESTAGLVVQYQGVQVAAFFVAGARQSSADCTGGTDDPTSTERYVTYNMGRSGDDVIQTPLGLVDPGNRANRGCLSQNGSDCLSDRGAALPEILRFYYGEDIEMVQAEGPCVAGEGPDAGTEPPADAGMDIDGATTGGTNDAGPTLNPVSGGCSAVGGLEPTGSAPLLLLALTLVISRPRSGRKSTRPRRR